MSQRRDTIVIGASSGGVQALRDLLSRLPPDLGASVFIVQHQSAASGWLTRLLESVSRLPVFRVEEAQSVRPGCVYVAPPDVHMVIAEGQVLAKGGARENRARPSINVLFRTAAAGLGSRVIGVLLTGTLDDGVAGLHAIKRCGGLAVVQDPEDAEFPELPLNAVNAVQPDHVLSLRVIAERLAELVHETALPVEVPRDIAIEAMLWDSNHRGAADLNTLGQSVPFGCPECGGPLWKIGEGDVAVYRCHTGHALSARTLLDSQADEIEHSLWVAVRSLVDRATMLDRLAEQAGSLLSAEDFRERAVETRTHAEQARQFLLSLRMPRPEQGAPGAAGKSP